MKWTVVWTDQAQDQLAEIWLAAPDRQAVSEASRRVDLLLRDQPLGVGEEREPPVRILLENPLALLYDVAPDDNLVRVFAVWYWKQRP